MSKIVYGPTQARYVIQRESIEEIRTFGGTPLKTVKQWKSVEGFITSGLARRELNAYMRRYPDSRFQIIDTQTDTTD